MRSDIFVLEQQVVRFLTVHTHIVARIANTVSISRTQVLGLVEIFLVRNFMKHWLRSNMKTQVLRIKMFDNYKVVLNHSRICFSLS